MVPPKPTEISDLSCITFKRRRPKQRQKARGWRKCLTAQMIWEGGSSQGTTLAKVIITPRSRRTPMLWFPLRVPSHILIKT